MTSLMRGLVLLAILTMALGCGYHRLDRRPGTSAWTQKGDTVRIASCQNQTRRLGLDGTFQKALENRIVAASPWRLVSATESSRWILQAVIESFEVRPLGLTLGGAQASAGTASRVEVIVVASLKFLDGQTGELLISRPRMTFSNQYRVDQNFASFDNRELQVIGTLADDFAESFLTQLLEGCD